jgi:hypothetical protein
MLPPRRILAEITDRRIQYNRFAISVKLGRERGQHDCIVARSLPPLDHEGQRVGLDRLTEDRRVREMRQDHASILEPVFPTFRVDVTRGQSEAALVAQRLVARWQPATFVVLGVHAAD